MALLERWDWRRFECEEPCAEHGNVNLENWFGCVANCEVICGA